MQKLLTFFSKKKKKKKKKKTIAYMPYLMISFNDTLTNDIFSFEQLGPDKYQEGCALICMN